MWMHFPAFIPVVEGYLSLSLKDRPPTHSCTNVYMHTINAPLKYLVITPKLYNVLNSWHVSL